MTEDLQPLERLLGNVVQIAQSIACLTVLMTRVEKRKLEQVVQGLQGLPKMTGRRYRGE